MYYSNIQKSNMIFHYFKKTHRYTNSFCTTHSRNSVNSELQYELLCKFQRL